MQRRSRRHKNGRHGRPVIACPRCSGRRCPVQNSQNLPVRYHKCRSCGYRFKSVETVVRGVPISD